METLDCRSPARCITCEHWLAHGCELERQLAAALAPRAIPVALAATPAPARALA